MNWSDLSKAQQGAIQRAYESGKEPGDIAPKYGLKPKQVSDQAYRKSWKRAGSKKKAGKKIKKKVAKKTGKKAKKKVAKKKARRR